MSHDRRCGWSTENSSTPSANTDQFKCNSNWSIIFIDRKWISNIIQVARMIHDNVIRILKYGTQNSIANAFASDSCRRLCLLYPILGSLHIKRDSSCDYIYICLSLSHPLISNNMDRLRDKIELFRISLGKNFVFILLVNLH